MPHLCGASDGVNSSCVHTGRPRLAGLSPGTLVFVAAWFVGAAIARLTGSSAVLLLLASAVIAAAAAITSSLYALRRVRVIGVEATTLVTVGENGPAAIFAEIRRSAGHLTVLDSRRNGNVLGSATFDQASNRTVPLQLVADHPGLIDTVWVEARTSGAAGLLWLKRSFEITIEPLHVAPLPAGPALEYVETAGDRRGDSTGAHGQPTGEIDGIRPWRDGDSHQAVHWPSSMRSSALVVYDRQGSSDVDWMIDATTLSAADSPRLRRTLEDGLSKGRPVRVRLRTGDVVRIQSSVEALTCAAQLAATEQRRRPSPVSLLRRNVTLRSGAETESSFNPLSRWLTAAASWCAITMLLGSIASSTHSVGLAAIGVLLGTLASLGAATRSRARAGLLRLGTSMLSVVALAYIASQVGGVTSLLGALRGPMPDLLILLIVLHGFEVIDRRTQRVHQAVGAVVIAYGTGLRIDDRIGWWLASWGALLIAAVITTTRPVQHDRARLAILATVSAPWRELATRGARGALHLTVAGAATFALLAVIPVPDGPASLGLPALSNNAPSAGTRGGLVGPNGGPSANDGTRGALGQAGGYPGFSETLDTSIRGDLGDQVVLRVRAPEPAFWRGQTFTAFDGRTWTVSEETGRPRVGPRIDIPPTVGAAPRSSSIVDVEKFTQTFYVETDLPNVVFAANRATSLTFDGTVWARPDGALRSDVTLTPGSAYTVISQRAQITPELLRAQGDIATFFTQFTDPVARAALDPFLEIPSTTTQRTIDLATELNPVGSSTYDTIRAYEAWLADNTVYDLDAPIPAAGVDAVDDFLFASGRGFCEQIASALTIMLRTQGVPARLATGYVPGVRDQVSGLFEVRASDAHAWVEVWFPDTGWQAFDPTANVPLSGEIEPNSVGGDVVGAAVSTVSTRAVEGALLIGAAAVALSALRALTIWRARRRRGRWGLLQDRFTALDDAPTNPSISRALDEAAADELAALLDRVAFDPEWVDDDDTYARSHRLLSDLERNSSKTLATTS